jgi:hypothetical protein
MFIALICITRIAGIVCISIAVFFVITSRNFSIKKKIVQGIAICLLGSSALILNLWRNYLSGNSLTGLRQKSVTPFYDNLQLINAVMDEWLQIHSVFLKTPSIIGSLLLFVSGMYLLWKLIKKEAINGLKYVLMVSFLAYCLLILLTSTISRYDPINNRLLSPAYIPFVLICATWGGMLFKNLHKGFVKSFIVVALLLCFIFFSYQQFASVKFRVKQVSTKGIAGFKADDWKKSAILKYLKQHQGSLIKDQLIYSNAPAAVYFHTGLANNLLPEKVHPSEISEYYLTSKHYLFWFYNETFKNELLSPDSISKYKHIDTIALLDDGAIYQIRQ